MKYFDRQKWQAVAVGMLLIGLVFATTGCGTKAKPTDNGENTSSQTQGTAVSETKSGPAKEFDLIIENLRKEIPYVAVSGKELTKEEAQSALDAMEMLYQSKGTSKEAYTLYTSKIEGLRGEMADQFSRYAIAILRKNSFDDYKPYEKYFSDMKHLEDFGKSAEAYDFNYYHMKQNADAISDEAVKKYVKEAAAQGYVLESTEGMVYPVVDYAVFAKYKAFHTKDFGAILDILAFGSVEVQMNDAAISVPLEHFSAIALEIEKALSNCEDKTVKKYLGAEYLNYMRTILFGSDNSPMYDYDSLKVREEVVTLYKKMAQIEDSQTAGYVKKHMALLEASGGKYDNATMEKINALISSIQKDYQLSDDDLNTYYNWLSGTVN